MSRNSPHHAEALRPLKHTIPTQLPLNTPTSIASLGAASPTIVCNHGHNERLMPPCHEPSTKGWCPPGILPYHRPARAVAAPPSPSASAAAGIRTRAPVAVAEAPFPPGSRTGDPGRPSASGCGGGGYPPRQQQLTKRKPAAPEPGDARGRAL